MKSIFNLSDNQEIIKRVQQLTPDTKALWGKNECRSNVTTLQ